MVIDMVHWAWIIPWVVSLLDIFGTCAYKDISYVIVCYSNSLLLEGWQFYHEGLVSSSCGAPVVYEMGAGIIAKVWRCNK